MSKLKSTPEEQIAILENEKQENLKSIDNINKSIDENTSLIKLYSDTVVAFQKQIEDSKAKIVELTAANSIIDEIIAKITPIKE
jgi:uncharacterized protein YPO0396